MINSLSNLSFNDVILFIIGFSSVVSVLAWTGFLPTFISNPMNLKKSEDTLMVLSKLGINPDKYKKPNIAKSIPSYIDSKDLESTVGNILKECTIKKPVGVGGTQQVVIKNYIDAMSMSTHPSHANQLARCLTSYWKKLLEENNGAIKTPDPIFVVTPKGGSPILGYEFSRIMKLPFALHSSGNKKFSSVEDKLKFKSSFDSFYKPKVGDTALIVDDSTTGGRKVLDTISDLRENGILVTDCLVLFEPTVKNVRDKLTTEGVNLHAIVEKKI